jgi:hypothetical protein
MSGREDMVAPARRVGRCRFKPIINPTFTRSSASRPYYPFDGAGKHHTNDAMACLAERGGVASWVTIAALSLQVPAGAEVVAVAFPMWWTTQQVMLGAASADASIVRTTAVPSLLVVRPGERDGLARLRQAGVWLIVDPQAIAACFSE